MREQRGTPVLEPPEAGAGESDDGKIGPERLGEIVAHTRHYASETLEAVLDALAYDARARASVDQARQALAEAAERCDIEHLKDFLQGHDVALQRLKVRRPALADARRIAKLVPHRAERAPSPTFEAKSAPSRDRSNQPLPSYLAGPGVGAPAPPPPQGIVVTPAAPSFSLSIGVPGAAAATPLARPSAGIATTGHIDPSRVRAGLKLPFDPAVGKSSSDGKLEPKPARAGESAIETFAMLTVALAGAEPRAETLERFGLTEETRHALATHWGDRIAKDPNLKSVFDEHVRKHRGR